MPHDLPIRKSTNPAIGVRRCGCGDLMTIHQSRGKRANFYYSICDTCGTDQRTGAPVQKKLGDFFPTLTELTEHESETKTEKPAIKAPQAPSEPSSQGASVENQGVKGESSRINAPEPSRNETDPQTESGGPFWVRGLFVAVGIIAGGLTGRAIAR